MKKISIILIGLLFMSFSVFAFQERIGGDRDEQGCLVAGGYSWNESEGKCVREWESGTERYQNRVVEFNGEELQIQIQERNRTILRSNDSEVDCNCTIEENENGLRAQFSNGKNAQIKIMPSVASENALARLRLKVCSEENNCTIELKEVGNRNQTRVAYEVQIERHARILGIFQTKMQNRVQVDAETGEVIDVRKPWWAFIATEPSEQ